MSATTDDEADWMHPAIWVLLFFFAPPVWLFLICCRFAGEIVIAFGILCAAFFAFWFFQTAKASLHGNSWGIERVK
jgi:hypothetical protein